MVLLLLLVDVVAKDFLHFNGFFFVDVWLFTNYSLWIVMVLTGRIFVRVPVVV